jgi:hypothetical protein
MKIEKMSTKIILKATIAGKLYTELHPVCKMECDK